MEGALTAVRDVESSWDVLSADGLDEFLSRETSLGVPLSRLRMQSGHFLVCKVPEDRWTAGRDGASIALPEVHRTKSVRNLVSIRGVVVRASEPWTPTQARYVQARDARGQPVKRSVVEHLPVAHSTIKPGDFIVYESYNCGQIAVDGAPNTLVIVREIDILCTFPSSDNVTLADRAMSLPAIE